MGLLLSENPKRWKNFRFHYLNNVENKKILQLFSVIIKTVVAFKCLSLNIRRLARFFYELYHSLLTPHLTLRLRVTVTCSSK